MKKKFQKSKSWTKTNASSFLSNCLGNSWISKKNPGFLTKGQYMEVLMEDLLPADFEATKSNFIKFSRKDSVSLQHTTTEYEWKDYCPTVFRRMMEVDNINYEDYQLLVCGDETLREVFSPGRSAKVFALPTDERFVVKTVRKCELKVYQEMLPNYYHHVKKFGASLLLKLYGLHVVRPVGGVQVYFSVWRNILPLQFDVHMCYDLKGSSIGRSLTRAHIRETAILKDMDFDYCFYLDPLVRARLLVQLKYDCDFLEAEGIMDYSLFIAMRIEASHEGSIDKRTSRSSSMVIRETDDYGTENESSELTLADVCDQLDRPGFRFGDRLPARAVRKSRSRRESKSYRFRVPESFNVLLYFAIVDFCKTYTMKKRIEHACKALKYDSKVITAVNPKAYSSRFQEFLSEVFLPEPEESD